MNWLLPSPPALTGSVRTVGNPQRSERVAAKHRRYRNSAKGRAAAERRKSARAAYHRRWYAENIERRRAYLAAKKREYRARMVFA